MARSVVRHVLAGFVGVALLAAPAAAANKEHQQMMADIRMLQEQNQRLQLQLAALTRALETITSKLDEQSGTSRKLFADEKLLLGGISDDLRVVREKSDDNSVRLGTLSQDLEALRQMMPTTPPPTPPTDLAAAGAPGAPPAGENPPPTPPAQAAPPPSPAEQLGMLPTEAYRRAQADYWAGDYQLAISGFEGFLKAVSRTDRADSSSQAPDAQFYIGEAYYNQGKLDQAIDAYTKVIAGYPSSSRVPEAYYKRGLMYERSGDKVHARESFQALISKYPPENQWVVMATQAMARLQETEGRQGKDGGLEP
jgi:tol-pal system protein YbgF